MKRIFTAFLVLCAFTSTRVQAQDSVDVTFRYSPTANPAVVYLVGEFNSWNNQSWPMTPAGNNTFVRTVRLSVSGHPGGGVPGAYQYKFYYSGVTSWPNDPLNHRTNPSENNNSVLYVRNPTIYQLWPNERSEIVREANPDITAYIFPKVGQILDTAALTLKIDSRLYTGVGRSYDPATQQFRFRVPDMLANGVHRITLGAGSISDSTTIVIQAGFIQITNLGNFTTRKQTRTIYGIVQDTTIRSVWITRNDADTSSVSVSAGRFSGQVQLMEGVNRFRALHRDTTGQFKVSEPVLFTYLVSHAPVADIYCISAGPNIILSAQGSSDPDSGQSQQLEFAWHADAKNPSATPAIDGSTATQVTVQKPALPGDYFVTLVATDPDGNKDTTRNYFTVLPDKSVETPYYASSPRWAREGRMYELFFKSMTPQGTIRAALPYLPYLKSLGVNILWIMPVMENAAPINNRSGPGYNIKNFFAVAPEYGSNDDFKEFVRQAHALGLRTILDVTPNHTSYLHPFVLEARQFRENSPYWDFYQHSRITNASYHPNLSESSTSDGFVYYSGFSDQLLNYNWSDLDARSYMIEVYKWWVREFDIDGYRLDVYWGPHRRAGGGAGNETEMGIPVRKALKKIKPDIFLLAEDDGTGSGTEVIFADRNGGVDAAYDWSLYGGAIKPFGFDVGSIENLHARYANNGFYPGQNALYLRFMENHDEDRIVFSYKSYEKTMPVATTLFTVPGLPLVYSGQEVGFGLGISDYDQRRRGVINWSSAGKTMLLPHYQRLALIRSQFKSFSSQKFIRLASGNDNVYAYLRPGVQGDALIAVNFSSNPQQAVLPLSTQLMESATQSGKPYFFNEVYGDSGHTGQFQNGSYSLGISLKPYGSAIYIISDSLQRVQVAPIVSVEKGDKPEAVSEYVLYQNYPNPFNPRTTISYQLAAPAIVSLKVFDVLGREVATLVQDERSPGTHAGEWNAEAFPSGVYVYRLIVTTVGPGHRQFVRSGRMVLVK